jgi:nucleotide-binding universal stress UspA family protein
MSKPRVMVAINNAASVESLVTLACQLTLGMDAELAVLHIVEVPLVTPLDAKEESIDHRGKELLARAQSVAAIFKRPVSTELMRAREVGEAIVGVAKERDVHLLVMGHHRPHHHSLGETLIGGTVQYVAHHAPCRVIVQIPAPEKK